MFRVIAFDWSRLEEQNPDVGQFAYASRFTNNTTAVRVHVRALLSRTGMSKGIQTQTRILNEALRQGTVRGFATVSLADVAAATGLSKSAVFKHYGAKEALQMAVLERLVRGFVESVWLPASQRPAGRTRLDTILDRWLSWVDGREGDGGCGIIQAQIEFDDQPGPLRSYLKRQQQLWNSTLVRQFCVLGVSREDAEQAAFEFRSLVLGYNQSHRLMNDIAARQHVRRAYLGLIARLESSINRH